MDERLWGILVDSFPKLLDYGIRVTVPLTIYSFAIALTVAVIVALIQYANVKVLRQICRFYIWIVRGTPLLVQLYIVFFGLPGIGIRLNAFPAAMVVLGFNEGRLLRGPELPEDYGACGAAAGIPDRVSGAGEQHDLHAEGNLHGRDDLRDGDVPPGAGDQRPGV